MKAIVIAIAISSAALFTGAAESSLSAGPQAADELAAMAAKLSASRISFDFSYRSGKEGGPEIVGTGHIEMQGDDYAMTQGSLEIRRFGDVKLTLDHDSKEAVAESCSDLPEYDITSNPSLVLTSFDKVFDCVSNRKITFEGRSCIVYELVPKAKDTGIKNLELYSEGQVIAGMNIKMTDGTYTRFILSNFRLSEKSDATDFSVDLISLEKDWFLTDLR